MPDTTGVPSIELCRQPPDDPDPLHPITPPRNGARPGGPEFGVRRRALLGDWYAHLFFESRKKCVLFVSEKTLLAFVAPAQPRSRIKKLEEVFRDGLFRLLLDEGFQPHQATPVFNECRTIRYAAKADRSMTGTVNEMVKDAQFWLPRHGGVPNPDLPALHHKLNRNPLKRNQYVYAIERTKQALDALAAG